MIGARDTKSLFALYLRYKFLNCFCSAQYPLFETIDMSSVVIIQNARNTINFCLKVTIIIKFPCNFTNLLILYLCTNGEMNGFKSMGRTCMMR